MTTLTPQFILSVWWVEYYLFYNELRTEKDKDEPIMAWKTSNSGMGGVLWSSDKDQK